MPLIEPQFGLNEFNKPKLEKGNNVFITTILMILFGKPGFYPSLPELGLNIQRYFYGFMDELDTEKIKSSLVLQCNLLSDLVINESIDVQKRITDDGRYALLILAPTMEKTSNNILVIGISTDATGTVVYNYEIMKSFM